MLAVLEDTLTCFQNYISARSKYERSLFCEAEEWIFVPDDNDSLFSFDNICETLGLSPTYIREGLLSWRNNRLGEWNQLGLGGEKSRYSSKN
jgi:hypothetical protein